MVFEKLKPSLDKANLNLVLREEYFTSYGDYLSDVLERLNRTTLILTLGSILAFLLYVIVVFQTFVLYIEAGMNEVLVKVLLGFKRKDIFKKVIFWNIGATLLPVITILALKLLNPEETHLINIMVCGAFIIMEVLVLFSMLMCVRLKNVVTKLKGDE